MTSDLEVEKVLTVAARVRTILERHPETTNSDQLLVIRYMNDYLHVKLPPDVENVLKRAPFKTIITTRQRIQQMGELSQPTQQ